MLKRWFDWTPRDIAAWERIRARGLRHFIAWYGLGVSGGILFLIPGGGALISGCKAFFEFPAAGRGDWMARLAYLALNLLFIAVFCLAVGVINSLVTWVVEERLYRKYKQGSEK